MKMVKGLRKGDWVRSTTTGEYGIVENIDRFPGRREITPMGVRVDWKGYPKDTGVTTFQYPHDLLLIKKPKDM